MKQPIIACNLGIVLFPIMLNVTVVHAVKEIVQGTLLNCSISTRMFADIAEYELELSRYCQHC
jgi:hypothetical protein